MAGNLAWCTEFSASREGLWGYGVLESTSGGCSDIIDGRYIHISYMEAAGWLFGVEIWKKMDLELRGGFIGFKVVHLPGWCASRWNRVRLKDHPELQLTMSCASSSKAAYTHDNPHRHDNIQSACLPSFKANVNTYLFD